MENSAANLLFEVGSLKNIPRHGWLKAGIKFPETIAEHSMRAAVLGWVLADMENADTDKVTKMCLLHDIAESRIGDLDSVAAKYFDKKKTELKAQLDLSRNMPKRMGREAAELYREVDAGRTREAIIAKDADRLEMFVQAHEYENAGHSGRILKEWKDSVKRTLKTKSAKALLLIVERSSFENWWDFARKPR